MCGSGVSAKSEAEPLEKSLHDEVIRSLGQNNDGRSITTEPKNSGCGAKRSVANTDGAGNRRDPYQSEPKLASTREMVTLSPIEYGDDTRATLEVDQNNSARSSSATPAARYESSMTPTVATYIKDVTSNHADGDCAQSSTGVRPIGRVSPPLRLVYGFDKDITVRTDASTSAKNWEASMYRAASGEDTRFQYRTTVVNQDGATLVDNRITRIRGDPSDTLSGIRPGDRQEQGNVAVASFPEPPSAADLLLIINGEIAEQGDDTVDGTCNGGFNRSEGNIYRHSSIDRCTDKTVDPRAAPSEVDGTLPDDDGRGKGTYGDRVTIIAPEARAMSTMIDEDDDA